MSAPQLFGVTRDEILTTRLPALGVRGSALPAYDALDTDGQILLEAAADIADALAKGGHGLEPTVTAAATPVAYYRLRGLLLERVALRYIQVIGRGLSADALKIALEDHERRMVSLTEGSSVGELEVTDGARRVQFSHGTATRDDVDARRRRATMEM